MIYVLSGGGTGGTLVVTGVAGDTVTATKDGKSYKRTFNASGIATFKGLKTGTWAITMTDGSQSVTQNVTINADYTLTMAYFSALITTTWPEGSTCSCTDGTSTLYAPDTSGSYTFNVPNKGTWTVTATNGDKTASKSVSVTAEGQTENVTLAYEYVLYEAGTKNVTFTQVNAGYAAKYRTITEGDNSVSFYVEGGDVVHSSDWSTTAEASTVVSTGWATDSIDLSAYNSIKVTLPSLICNEAKSTAVVLGVSSSSPNISVGSGVTNSVAQTVYNPSATSETELSITCDVSSISSGYLVFGVWSNRGSYAGKGTATATMNKLWLE